VLDCFCGNVPFVETVLSFKLNAVYRILNRRGFDYLRLYGPIFVCESFKLARINRGFLYSLSHTMRAVYLFRISLLTPRR
jgi:hypothetical protein